MAVYELFGLVESFHYVGFVCMLLKSCRLIA